MKKTGIITIMVFATILWSCNSKNSKTNPEVQNAEQTETEADTLTKHLKPFNPKLQTIGLLMYEGVFTTEVTAAANVFTKPTKDGKQLFNVVTIAPTKDPVVAEEGLTIVPDYAFENSPELDVLFVPSAYNMYSIVRNEEIIAFIKEKNKETKYIVSNCAGAQLIGASGIAKGRKIVTYIGGGEQLQKEYPALKVQNDSSVTYVKDGKFLSSNGSLASYVSALNLLEIMTSPEHAEFVESQLYLDRLQNWKE